MDFSEKINDGKKKYKSTQFQLASCTVRFELVYKNLLRDVRKSFWLNFNKETEFK